jgi:hypothetical protein
LGLVHWRGKWEENGDALQNALHLKGLRLKAPPHRVRGSWVHRSLWRTSRGIVQSFVVCNTETHVWRAATLRSYHANVIRPAKPPVSGCRGTLPPMPVCVWCA